MKKNAGPVVGVLILLAAVAAVEFSVKIVYEYDFGRDRVGQTLQFLAALLGCAGAGIIFVFLMFAYGIISNEADERRARRIIREGKAYTVRCTAILMQKWDGDLPAMMDEEPGQERRRVLHCEVQMSNHGLAINRRRGAAAVEETMAGAASAAGRFARERSDPILVDLRDVNLYYVTYRREGDVELETVLSEALGYKDATPKIPEGSQLKIVLLLRTITHKSRLATNECLEQPWQLKMVALDRKGRDSARTTARLYAMLYREVASAQEEIDYSWMYGSRPIYW